MSLFDRRVIATHRGAVFAQDCELMPYLCDVATDEIAGVGQTRDRAQRHLFPTAGDHHRGTRPLRRLRLEDRILDMKIAAVERRARLGP
jgi:hypothetical protein